MVSLLADHTQENSKPHYVRAEAAGFLVEMPAVYLTSGPRTNSVVLSTQKSSPTETELAKPFEECTLPRHKDAKQKLEARK